MRIKRLELVNFRTFPHLILEDLPDFVLLVSPNGGGKSSILESIAGVKDIVVPYSADQYQVMAVREGRNQPVWPNHLREPIRLGEAEARVLIEAEPNESERARLEAAGIRDTIGKASLTIQNGRFIVKREANATIENLFKYHNPTEGIGFVDYTRPYRYFDRQNIGDPTQPTNDGAIRNSLSEFQRSWQDQQKFMSFKNFVVASDLADHSHRKKTGEEQDSLATFREVFNQFFAPKRFLGYNTSPRGEAQVAVTTPWGEQDIDVLSDGEKELLFILGHLYRFRSLHNVVLWDTPEAHLNAALESRLYDGLRLIAPNNQYWLATHSLELIGSVPLESVMVLRQTSNGVQLERPAPTRKARVELYRQLGAQVGLQLIASRVVFVEGTNDERVLQYLGEIAPSVKFADSGGVRSLKGVVDVLIEASDDDNFAAISDRDDLTDGEIEEAENRSNGRLHVWRRREIENYLLDETAIWDVLQEWTSLRRRETTKITSQADVVNLLDRAAQRTKPEVVAKKVAHRINGLLGKIKINAGDLEKSLQTAFTRRAELRSFFDPAEQKKIIATVTAEVDAQWRKMWKEICLGKETIEYFLRDNFADVNDAVERTFIEKVCRHMKATGKVPAEVVEVIRLIAAVRS